MEKNKLVSFWWYRLLKLIFVFTFIVSVIFGFLLTNPNIPKKIQDTTAVCNIGNKYTSSYLQSNYDMDILNSLGGKYSEANMKLIYLCENHQLPKVFNDTQFIVDRGYKDPTPYNESLKQGENYKIVLVGVTEGSWRHYFYSLVILELGVLLVFWFIRRAFIYTVVGEKFFSV